MGCGKSKHAVETATTVVKSSTNSDGAKETTATKTVKVTGDSSLLQKEVETKSAFVEDTKEKTVTTKVDPSGIVGPALAENVEKPAQGLKEDVKVKDSNPTDNVVPTSAADEVVKEDEKVKDLNQADGSGVGTDNVVPTSSKDDVGITEAVKEDEGKRESTLKADTKAKTNNVPPTEEETSKESNPTNENKTKTEFMTPTSEDVGGPFEVVKGSEEVKDSKEEKTTTATSIEKPVKTIDGSSNPKDDNLKVEEQKLVALATESTKVEAKKEEDVEVTKVDIAKTKISPATETEKVPTANEVT
ncbi:hypothetical protein L1987_09508 [Smallanthus sonchifolius]|uniref:Uncharacterized protein n=1 Tax=Smallanthus sonchifolius TaxID=185202 RepID=A0ACB9JNK5_9ASTR|nr:hypothetical protein L1987_09508 [Smallanthus sonchifolius]